MDNKLDKNGPGVKKRPEIALYKPGMGKILGKKGDNEPNVPQKSDSSEDQKQEVRPKSETKPEPKPNDAKDNKCFNNNNNNNKGVNKKPDIKVYVPPKPITAVVDTKPVEKPLDIKPKQRPNDRNRPQNTKSVNSRQNDRRNERYDRNERTDRSERTDKIERRDKPERQDRNERTDNERPERNERIDRNIKPERMDRNERIGRNERPDRHEKTDRNERALHLDRDVDRHDRQEKSDNRREKNTRHERNERHERTERTDKRERIDRFDRKDRQERPERSQTQTETKNTERYYSEDPNIAHSFESHKRLANELPPNFKSNENVDRKVKAIAPKISHNFTENPNQKFERHESYEDYYNIEFKQNQSKGNRNQRHNRIPDANHPNINTKSDNNFNSNENKSRMRPENTKQRNHSSNKSQHNRYVNTFEQQIPPRFLKQQQLKKQIELKSERPVEPNQYENQRSDSLSEQMSSADPTAHRGLIRLPANNQLNQSTDWNVLNASQPTYHSHHNPSAPKPLNSNKPCVAIRPTQHVAADNPPQYSPSSSPDTNSLSTVNNYQQMSPYMRSNSYSEYTVPHFTQPSVAENSENTVKKLKPLIEKSLNEAMAAENDLLISLNDGQKVEQIRYRIQLRFEHIILNDLRVCAEMNIEQRLWKSAFYQFIEHYRRLMEQNSDQSDQLKTSLHKIIDEASLFFENLLVKMQETYDFVIEKLLAHEYDSETENYDIIKLASISAQKIYLYLGDLSRYRECETKNSNFVKSKHFYLRAQMLAPKNGRSYNQLALLAMYQNRRLDAVYYYMRSLAASSPFLTARENLLAIFDEVRRKYELTDKKRKQDLLNQKKRNQESDGLSTDKERIEIWIRSDGTSDVCSNTKHLFENEAEVSQEEKLDSLSSVDLNKRFVLSFLHTHGKLFSKVGMETFIPVVNQMLAEFRSLLGRSPVPIMSQRLSQLLAINMFAVFHTSLKDTSYGQNCRSLLQEQAIQVTFAMISLILECAINCMKEQKRIESNPDIVGDDLSELLPTIKIWTDWMSCQKQQLWCPPPPPSDFKLDCRGDIWSIFAEFLTLLTKINVRSVKLLGSKLEGTEPIILPEDTALAGFLPLLGSPQCVQFAQPNYDREKARTCLRLTAIQYFGDYLCGIVEPYLKYDVEKKRFVSLITTSVPITPTDQRISKQLSELEISETETDEYSNDMSSMDTNSAEANEAKSPEQIEIQKLWSLQETLQKAKDRQEIIKQTVDAVLTEENQRKPSRIIIQPRYVIPDTNCYIDHLDKIQRLINCKIFDLIVPLIVVNELNGLKARGMKTAKPLTFTTDHIGNVGKAAAETLDYLSVAFNDKNLRLKSITSKGSLLDNIHFTSETFTDSTGQSNDDYILSACQHFIKDKPLDKTTKESSLNSDESNSLFREVVLLTDDRNLRIKALGHNVPVKSLPHFVKWANIPIKPKNV